jgi:ribosomal protein L11 methyltransferase
MYHTRLEITCPAEFTELLMAEIAEAGFDTFMETEDGFEGYVEMENFDKDEVTRVIQKYAAQGQVTFAYDRIEKQNWNEQWEKGYDPINVEDQCLIRASFHAPDKKFPYEIVITPKMSFGTGHHQTTYLMVKNQLQMDHVGKRILDAGCGTAILSIMACKRGATEVQAFDIDEWSIINGNENVEVNGCASSINLQQGKITEVTLSGMFDIVLANINKNVLLDEIKLYQKFLTTGGLLLLSGFFTQDIDDLKAESSRYGFSEVRRDEKENWASLLLVKY